VIAARAGHVHCLQQQLHRGQFLDIYSPYRDSASWVCKEQVWRATATACRADQAGVMRWLFSSRLPAEVYVELMNPFPILQEADEPVSNPKADIGAMPFHWPEKEPLQQKLYRYAMQHSNPACLEAMLNAGFPTQDVVMITVLEGRADFLTLAAERNCPCDDRSVFFAAWKGNLQLLEFVCPRAGLARDGGRRLNRSQTKIIAYSMNAASGGGHVECLEALFQWFGPPNNFYNLAVSAAGNGHLECLQALHRYVLTILLLLLLLYLVQHIDDADIVASITDSACGATSMFIVVRAVCLF
jgi:hypothetical protein